MMDPYKLLSRSTKLSKNATASKQRSTPPSGQSAQPQLFLVTSNGDEPAANASRKRKRAPKVPDDCRELEFFSDGPAMKVSHVEQRKIAQQTEMQSEDEDDVVDDTGAVRGIGKSAVDLFDHERKAILREHKLKVTWINQPVPHKKERRKGKDEKMGKIGKSEKISLFPQPLQSFSELRARYGISGRLATNIEDQGYTTPTEVQLGAMPVLLDKPEHFLSNAQSMEASGIDLLTVAPTGSGKTLAFMIPLFHKITLARRGSKEAKRKTSAIILGPTKELAGQIVNEGRKLARESGIKVTLVRKGMKLAGPSSPPGTGEVVDDESQPSNEITVKSDVLVSTPGLLAGAIKDAEEHGSAALSDVRHLVLDEADVLLDPLFREQTLEIWNSVSNANLRVSLWSATMGSNIEELAHSVINERRIRLSQQRKEDIPEAPLVRLVVGLKDSAVRNVQHKLVYAASEQGKLMGLRQLLHPVTTSVDAGPPLLPPFLVFTQTIERAVALHSELLYDIPAEAGGISRIAVLHSDLSDTARDSVMTRFRKGELWVIITTDLLSRGVDFRGVNGVVNYDIPTSSAAYVHRVGRTGRAGREGGVAVTLYSKEDIPYLKSIANVIAAAQKQDGAHGTGISDDVQQWLLDALPSLSKKAKQDLKKRGVESRTARGLEKDPKAAKKARISSKAGFVRREENKRKGAILGSRKRQEAIAAEDADETAFGGFD